MGAVGNQATYIRQLIRIMKGMRNGITLDGLRAGVEASAIPDHLKLLARDRLDLASDFIDDAAPLTDVVRPGRLVIVDLREEFIEKDQALGLFVVCCNCSRMRVSMVGASTSWSCSTRRTNTSRVRIW